MPSDSPTLRERYAADLRSGSTPVLVTAVLVAVAAGLATALYAPGFEWGFLLMVLVGVQLPMSHETHWPASDGWVRDVAWTLLVSAVVLALFAAVALLASRFDLRSITSAVVAFVVGLVALDWGVRRFARRGA